MAFVLFAHMLGIAMWIGGELAGMMVGYGARGEAPQVKAGAYRLISRLYTMIIGVGALVVLGTGVLLTMSLYSGGLGDLVQDARLWVMILAGLAAGLLVLFVGMPTASRMGALAVASEQGEFPAGFEVYRKRQAVLSKLSAGLAVVALLAWYVL
ncbi:MAG: hypothetical protein PVH40_01740 [Gemmatimonadales bacterium]|jgi:uncharacterized membrane protein